MAEKYLEKVETFMKDYVNKNLSMVQGHLSEEDVNHIIDIACSIVYTRDEVMTGGGFVTAVVDDKLGRAISCADSICIRALRLFANVRDFVHFNS